MDKLLCEVMSFAQREVKFDKCPKKEQINVTRKKRYVKNYRSRDDS